MLQDERPTALPCHPRVPSPVPAPSSFRHAVPGGKALFTLELFRLLAQFRAGYDARLLARADALATEQLGEAADEAMAAAVQIDNEFRCRTPMPYVDGRLGSRSATRREIAFLRMLDALEAGSIAVARRAAETLDMSETHALFAAGRRLNEALQAMEEAQDVALPVTTFAAGRANTPSVRYG